MIKVSDRQVKCLSEEEQRKLATAYYSGKDTNKASLGRKFGVSVRTVSRVLLLQKEYAEAQLVRRKSHGKRAKQAKAKKPDVTYKALANSFFVSVTADGKTYCCDMSHPNFHEALQAVKEGRPADAVKLIDIKTAVVEYSGGNFVIRDNRVYYRGLEIKHDAATLALSYMREGKPFRHLLKFLDKCIQNPDTKAVTKLFDFIVRHKMELTADGDFIAFKRVREDFRDFYTGTVDWSLGKVVKMDREDVEADDSISCAAGLHVASKSYLPSYHGGRGIVISVVVNPVNVVAIPYHDKMRVCEGYVPANAVVGIKI